MAKARTLVLDTRVNVTGEEKLSKLGKQYETAGAKMKAAISPGNLLAGAGIALGAQQIISFFGDAVQAAGEFEDTVSATGVIFEKEAIPALEAWAEESATAFGASKQDALAAANSMAVFGKSAGLAGQDLIDFSTELTQLGGDLASMFGGQTEDAIAAVGSALRGEFEPIRRYGVLLDAATLQQKAFELGIVSSTKNALTPQQKVLAAQASIMEQTTDAQGDFARTSDGLMNSQRILAAELENVTIEIGEKLLPIMVELVHFVSRDAIPVLEDLVEMADEVGFAFGEIGENFNFGAGFADLFGTLPDDASSLERVLADLNITALQSRPVFDHFEGDLHRGVVAMRGWVAEGITFEQGLADLTDGLTILPPNIKAATAGIEEATVGLGAGMPVAMQTAVDETVRIAATLPGSLASVLEPDVDDYQKKLDELIEVSVNSVSDLAERQAIEGVLASEGLTDALNSDSTQTRLLAQQFVEDRIAEYELLAPGALAAGELVNPALLDGVESNIDLAAESGRAVVNAAGEALVDLPLTFYNSGVTLGAQFNAGMASYIEPIRATSIALGDAAASGLRLRSPAEEGALSEDASIWGRRLGEMFASGMQKSVSIISAASVAMGGAAVPALGLQTGTVSSLSPMAAGAAGGVTNIYLQWDGEPPKGRSESEIVSNLQRLLPLARGY